MAESAGSHQLKFGHIGLIREYEQHLERYPLEQPMKRLYRYDPNGSSTQGESYEQ